MNADFKHIHVPGDPRLPALLLLHGTGGDERDLVELGRTAGPDSALLSVRGRVLENGMPRFFRRLSEGVFDPEDLAFRTRELAEFIEEAKAGYGLAQPLYALGYSNGANIASSLLLTRPETLQGAILLRAMTPFEPDAVPDLSDKKILMLSGLMDPIVPADNTQRLAQIWKESGADLRFLMKPAGHGLTPSDVSDIKSWMASAIPVLEAS